MGQGIVIVTLPFITRIYGPENMGIWASIYAITSIISVISDLGLSQALMIERQEDVEFLYRTTSTISLTLSIVASALVCLYECLFGSFALPYALVFSLIVLLYSFSSSQVQTCYTLLNRDKQYSLLMKNPVINYSVMAVVSIGLGLLGFIEYGYFIGMTAGQVVTLLHMRRAMPHRMFTRQFKNMRAVLCDHLDFVRYQMPGQLAVMVRQQLPNLMVGALFGNTILGYYSISQKLLSIPVTFLGQALGKVFYQTLAEMRRQGKKVADFIYRNLQRAMMIAAVPMILIAAFGDAAIVLFFGREYALGGVICRIIVFRAFMTFISTSTQGMDVVLNRQRLVMLTCIYQTILSVVSVLAAAYLFQDILVASLLITVSFIAVQIWYFCKMFTAMEYPYAKYLKSTLLSIMGVLIASLLLRQLFLLLAEWLPWDFLRWLASCLVPTRL